MSVIISSIVCFTRIPSSPVGYPLDLQGYFNSILKTKIPLVNTKGYLNIYFKLSN